MKIGVLISPWGVVNVAARALPLVFSNLNSKINHFLLIRD
jgi:hypothetical protein